jgi:hypothetical protein
MHTRLGDNPPAPPPPHPLYPQLVHAPTTVPTAALTPAHCPEQHKSGRWRMDQRQSSGNLLALFVRCTIRSAFVSSAMMLLVVVAARFRH